MLKVTTGQIARMDCVTEEQFLDQLTTHHLPGAGRATPRSALRASIATFVKRASQYGMTERAAIAAFVGLGLEFGPFFDYHPEIRQVMNNASIPPNLRVELLPDLVPSRVWSELPDFHIQVADELERRAASR